MTERAMMFVYVNPIEETEAAWHEWYENIHIPDMLTVMGVKAARRCKLDGAGVLQMGRDQQLVVASYLTVYELEGESIEAIRADIAVHAAKWKETGRSFAGNRVVSNTVYRLIG